MNSIPDELSYSVVDGDICTRKLDLDGTDSLRKIEDKEKIQVR